MALAEAYALIRYEEGLHTNVMSSILLLYNYKQLITK